MARPLCRSTHPLLTQVAGSCICLLLASCGMTQKLLHKDPAKAAEKKTDDNEKKKETASTTEDADQINVDLLLSMSYEEAAAISEQKGEVPGVARVAGDRVDVMRSGPNGEVRRLRIRGHVFLEMDGGGDRAAALAQEAYVTEDEIVLRGRPVLKRGKGLIEGTTDHTVFYVFDNQVRVIGRHRVRNGIIVPRSAPRPTEVFSALMGNVSRSASPPPLPESAGPWSSAPNPLLPPLDLSAVPEAMREDLRRQAEAERVLQEAKKDIPQLPVEPLPLPEEKPSAPPQTAPDAAKPQR